MPCHGETHNSETEKSDFSHVCDPWGLPAPSSLPDGMLEKGRWAGSALETVPPRMWSAHNKPCAMKGNGSVWRAGMVCARIKSQRLRFHDKGRTSHERRHARSFQH